MILRYMVERAQLVVVVLWIVGIARCIYLFGRVVLSYTPAHEPRCILDKHCVGAVL